MDIKGTLQPRDLRMAWWLHNAPGRAFAVIGISLLALFVWVIWASLASMFGRHSNAWFWFLAVFVFCYIVRLLLLPSAAARAYRQRKALQRELQLTVLDKGLDYRNENGHMTLPWSDYYKWKESKTLYLLYPIDGMFFGMIPKRFFRSQGEVDAFREILKANVVDWRPGL